jgi:hypothetical protein
VLAGAVSKAMRADVIMVAIRATEGFPLPFYVWVGSWLPHRLRGKGELVALVAPPKHAAFIGTAYWSTCALWRNEQGCLSCSRSLIWPLWLGTTLKKSPEKGIQPPRRAEQVSAVCGRKFDLRRKGACA